MAAPTDFRPPVFRNPYAPRRGGGTIRGFSQGQMGGGTQFEPTYAQPTPQEAAMGLFQIGMRSDAEGNVMPTQDYGGIMRAASSQINPLSRGVRPGQFSSLGMPANTMYEQNPGFFRRGPSHSGTFNQGGFGQQIAQRNQAMQSGGIPNPQRPGYVGPYRPGFSGVTEQQKMQNRAALQEQVDAKRMLGQATGDIPTVRAYYTDSYAGPKAKENIGRNVDDAFPDEDIEKRGFSIGKLTQGGEGLGIHDASNEGRGGKYIAGTRISGKYGTGSAEFFAPGTPRKEGLINGRPASEVLQGLANKPGIARAGDRFQPQKTTPAQTAELNKALSKFPMKNPLMKR